MLTVNTYLAPSSVHGIGLFASEAIPARTVIWKFNRHIDKIFSPETFLALCRNIDRCSLRHLLNSTYKRGGRYFYLTDNARFINHCQHGHNIAFIDDYFEVAVKDIAPDEELLEDYRLCYDDTDFFFQEQTNPDPNLYLRGLEAHSSPYV